MRFLYTAQDHNGDQVRGEVEAVDADDARSKIRALGLTPVDLAAALVGADPGRADHTDTTTDRAAGVATGCAAGSFVGIGAIAIGVILCLTGIGAIIGVPLIIVGIVAIVAGPFAGLGGTMKGPCPYCGADVHSAKSQPGVTCPACRRRIIIRDRKFYRID